MDANEHSSHIRKDTFLKTSPVFLNNVEVDEVYPASCTLSYLHFHEFVEISYVQSGSGFHRCWNKTTECAKGDMFILNVGAPHSYFAKSETEMPRVSNLLFDPADFFEGAEADVRSPDYCFGIFSVNASCAYLPLKSRQMEVLENLGRVIQREILEKEAHWFETVRSYLTIYLITIKRFMLEKQKNYLDIKSGDKAVISRVVQYVMENYSDNSMTLESIAQSMYISKSYLSRMFHSVTGEYFSDYVRNVRLKQACRLLEETQLTNEQIINNCGFKDIPTFYQIFKAQYMHTPNQYRSIKAGGTSHTNARGNILTGTDRVRSVLAGKPVDRQPIYGWIAANLSNEITEEYGSVSAFEDHYEFDLAHIFAGPCPFRTRVIQQLRARNMELTPDLLVHADIFTSPDNPSDYRDVSESLTFYKKRGRFCYIQTPGFFENFNQIFGFQNHLLYYAMYPEELYYLYSRQADWTIRFAGHCIDLGVDMIHISDDWGSQHNLLFSPKLWRELIYPNLKRVVDYVHSRGCYVSLHSDGDIHKLCPHIAELGIDVVHPWQERAGMSYDLWLDNYADRFAIFGGICVQTALGIMGKGELEEEIRRVFGRLRGRRWICCTTQFVQQTCSMDELKFAYNLIYRLARE